MSSKVAGEHFELKLPDYFVEQQGGRKVDLTLHYTYSGVLPLEQMPDYRLVQLLVEDVLYDYESSFIDTFWEMQNRELVRRVLQAFPQIACVRCEFAVRPSELMAISRTSIVEWTRADLHSLGPGFGGSMKSYRDVLGESTDSFWYPRNESFNIGAPRALIPSLLTLFKAIKEANDAGGEKIPNVWLSFVPVQLQAMEGTYSELIRLAQQCGNYDALVLPRCCSHALERSIEVGKLTGVVKVTQKEDTMLLDLPCAVESSLGALLGSPPNMKITSLADSREGFFVAPPKYSAMVIEKKFESAFTGRGYKTHAAFEGEPLELCLSDPGDARKAEIIQLCESLVLSATTA